MARNEAHRARRGRRGAWRQGRGAAEAVQRQRRQPVAACRSCTSAAPSGACFPSATAARRAVARFEGIADRSAAEALRGSLVEVDRAALPPLEEGEYYHADLIGLPAVDRAGSAVGTVVAVENYGAGDLLEIELSGGKRSLIPFKPGIADLEDGRDRPRPGFLA